MPAKFVVIRVKPGQPTRIESTNNDFDANEENCEWLNSVSSATYYTATWDHVEEIGLAY